MTSMPPIPPPPSLPLDGADDPVVRGDGPVVGPRRVVRPASTRLERTFELLACADAAVAEATALLDVALADGDAVRQEGLSTEAALVLLGGRSRSDAAMLVTAAQVLRHLPTVVRWFDDRLLSWGHVRAIVSAASRLPVDRREELERRLRAEDGRAADVTAETIVRLVDDLVARLRPQGVVEDVDAAHDGRFVALTPDLFGGGTAYSSLDPVGYATFAEALDHAAGRQPALDPDRPDPADRGSLGRRRADGLVDLAEAWLAGHRDTPDDGDDPGDATDDPAADTADTTTDVVDPAGAPAATPPADPAAAAIDVVDPAGAQAATPTRGRGWDAASHDDRPPMAVCRRCATLGRPRSRVLVGIDFGDLDRLPADRLAWLFGPAAATRLAGRDVAALLSDATLTPVVTVDGAPVAVGRDRPTIPSKTRQALVWRDRGCRWPGCDRGPRWTDAHHVIAAPKGPTELTNLVLLCRRHHNLVTRRRWRLALDPDGTVTVTRGRRTLRAPPPVTGRVHPDP